MSASDDRGRIVITPYRLVGASTSASSASARILSWDRAIPSGGFVAPVALAVPVRFGVAMSQALIDTYAAALAARRVR